MTAASIKPIPTRYAGRLFRSRLEARFALFFNELGIVWEYEPEGFDLPSGWYLPDFYLPKMHGGTWIEVKPWGPGYYFGFGGRPKLEDTRLNEFASRVEYFFVAYGLPDPNNEFGYRSHPGYPGMYILERSYSSPGLLEAAWDPHYWCMCGCGRTAGIEFDGRGDRVTCQHTDCTPSNHGDKGYSFDHERILQAATAAHEVDFRRP
jgi:hypothetical protein